jgi:hypothetical protein
MMVGLEPRKCEQVSPDNVGLVAAPYGRPVVRTGVPTTTSSAPLTAGTC